MVASLLWFNREDRVGQMMSQDGKIFFIDERTQMINVTYLFPGSLADITLVDSAFSVAVAKAEFNYGINRSEVEV